jgi:hypothetical protein
VNNKEFKAKLAELEARLAADQASYDALPDSMKDKVDAMRRQSAAERTRIITAMRREQLAKRQAVGGWLPMDASEREEETLWQLWATQAELARRINLEVLNAEITAERQAGRRSLNLTPDVFFRTLHELSSDGVTITQDAVASLLGFSDRTGLVKWLKKQGIDWKTAKCRLPGKSADRP